MKKELSGIKIPKDIGVIVRTAGSGCKRKDFDHEISYLTKVWENIKREGQAVKGPRLIHQEFDLVMRVVRDLLSSEVDRLLVDDKEEFKKIARFVGSILNSMRMRIKYYRGEKPLFEHFGIEDEIAKIYEARIHLKNRGHIVIEQTEALVSIDVNTGGFTGRKNLEETAFLTNMEAAREIARQVRLRDMGGIIAIDFIDMEQRDHRHKVFIALKDALKRDKARTKVLNISQLGLVEMTRQRMRRSVESMSYKICPYCNGRGSVKSVTTVGIEARRKIVQALKKRWPNRELHLCVHPEVCDYLTTQDKSSIAQLESRYRRKIIIKAEPEFHIEEINIS
ncbi:MAG: ribonuclease E/G [Candidatus Omnitrophota bacterium]